MKRIKIITILLLPILTICFAVGLSLYWLSDKKQMTKINRSKHKQLVYINV